MFVKRFDGPAAYAAILVAEEILDIFQRDLMKDERVQPLTRETSRIHVLEEARHMRFAREEVARRAPELGRWQLRRHRTAVATVAAIVADNLVQPEVYASVGLDPKEARAAARANEHYAAKLRGAAAGLVGFLRGVGLIGGPSFLETVATGVRPSVKVYSWSRTLPWTSRSGPSPIFTTHRSRSGLISAFLTSASRWPSASSISIESLIRAIRSWIFASSRPWGSSRTSVLRSRRALPSTL
jgi:hypothetical protein